MKVRFNRRTAILILSQCAAAGLLAFAAHHIYSHLPNYGYYWNSTASLPLGLYRVANYTTNYVIFCPTGAVAQVSDGRTDRGAGSCPDGRAPILKQIAARPGDIVQVSPAFIAVNGRRLKNTQQYRQDSQKRPMPLVPRGTYTVQAGTLWVLSEFNPTSFDSRYFGPIRSSDINHYVRPIFAF